VDEDAFTLTGIAFPVAPDNLDGFTIDGFQWVGGPEIIENVGGIFRRAVWSWPRQVLRALWSWNRIAKWRPGVAVELEPMQLVMTLSESRIWGFDFSDAPEVADGSTIIDAMASGAFVPASVAGLTFGAVTVTSTAFDDIPATGGLKAQITASIVGTYQFAMKGTTTAGRILVIPCEMVVVADNG
jgi:hypothetical protein